MYANVIIEYPIKSLDKDFTYKVPDNLKDIIKVGMKVIVPFGKVSVNGVVLALTNNAPEIETKEIISIPNPDIYLNKEQLELGKYLKEETLCALITAYQTMLPSALKIKNQEHNYDKYDIYVKLCDDKEKIKEYKFNHPRSTKQILIIDYLNNNNTDLKKNLASSALNILIKEKIVLENKIPKHIIDIKEKEYHENTLNDEQEKTYNEIANNLDKYNTYLLEGVTGSGKTEVYMHLIKNVIDKGKKAIVLVPEICLTTQTVKRFYDRFGSRVAVFHSGLSNSEKYDEYKKIYKNEVDIVVGTRSSIFVPFENLGIIIIDEEHSDTYKQDSNPRYNAIDMAIFRAKYHNIPLVLASATPQLESRARADKNVYKLLTLTKRVNNNPLPKVSIVDMTEEIKYRRFIISKELEDSIRECLLNKEQIILLLNRRGFSTFISCSACGYTYKCPNCDITLTYHKTTNNLRCHYCGYCKTKDDKCPSCGEDGLTYLGLGTQKLEEEIKKLFPEAKIIRMDQDTTSTKGSYQSIIDDFENEKYDILLGTQMISKGLDFKNVTLVGVINADTSLNLPDFRASEKTFSLLYQTSGRSGRSGRSKKEGKVIIQTFNPDNEVINFVKENDYNKFYIHEMNIRHKLKYPPYTYICNICIKGKDYETLSKEATQIKRYLTGKLDNKTIIFGPTPAAVFKVNNIYNFQITIKYTFDDNLKKVLKALDENYGANKNVNIEITFNPSRF